MTIPTTRHPIVRSGCALALLLPALAACGSSESEGPPAEISPAAPAEVPQTDTPVEGSTEVSSLEEQSVTDETTVEECDASTRVFTPFTDELPADWPASFPQPENLERISGDVGVGCGYVTVDMRSRYYGESREWVANYGDTLEAAGFSFDDEYDELNQLSRTYTHSNDFIAYGGPIELEDRDGEYIAVGVTIVEYES